MNNEKYSCGEPIVHGGNLHLIILHYSFSIYSIPLLNNQHRGNRCKDISERAVRVPSYRWYL